MKALQTLCQKLGYSFKNMRLLEDALSHRSFQGNNYERLEFLGDAVLNVVIATVLFHKCPKSTEGELSRLRASLVCGETLAKLALEFQLGNFLRLGVGELKSGGAQRTSILADAMEAIVGAVYLDGGFSACESCILNWFGARLENISGVNELKDAKTRLQEYLQSRKFALPVYTILSIEGAAHQQLFRIECNVAPLNLVATGEGVTRRRAEQEAARKILELIKK